MAARTAQRAIMVHPGPYRCVVGGCRAEAVYGENFSLSRHGKGWCIEHAPKAGR